MSLADGCFAAQVKGTIAVERYGRADEFAGMVACFASPEGAFITGATIVHPARASVLDYLFEMQYELIGGLLSSLKFSL